MTTAVRELFTLERAERTVRAYAPDQAARVREWLEAADRRALAGRRTMQTVAACALLRDAVVCYLMAAAAARADALESTADLATSMPALRPDPARPRATPTDDERARAAIAAREPLYFDRLSADDAACARRALDRAASMLRGRIEARSLAHIRGARWGRIAGTVLGLVFAAVAGARALWMPRNVALHKPVTASSVWYTPAAGQDIVDGDTGTSFGLCTKIEDSPYATIDLLDTYRVYRVAVHNRVDGWFDDCLPLVVELSTDGKNFHEIGRRETHFEGNPPWVVDAHKEAARYVRVRVARKSYLALSEVEVFGKKRDK